MADELVRTATDDRVRTVTLDRPEKLNALSEPLLAELEDALLAAEDDDVRVVVLEGAGDAFSVGYDFGEPMEKEITPEDYMGKVYSHVDVIWNLDVPVIAAVDGYALAGGTNLSLICDLTFATERSEFGFPDVHMGVLPPRLVVPFVADSLKDARELLYTGKHVSAAEAERMGLINRVVPDADALDAAIDAEIVEIKKTPSSVVKLLKDTLNDVQHTQGYRSDSAGKIDEYLMALSTATEVANEFDRVRAEGGVNAAIEWMHEAEKD